MTNEQPGVLNLYPELAHEISFLVNEYTWDIVIDVLDALIEENTVYDE